MSAGPKTAEVAGPAAGAAGAVLELQANPRGRTVMTETTERPAAIDPMTLKARFGSGYPAPFAGPVKEREKRALGDVFGLSHFGVNLVRLPPGSASSQRHWHSAEDEFVYILEGEVELVTDAGAQRLTAGMVAGFPAGRADGHQLVNRSDRDVVYLEVGDRQAGDEIDYPDIDLRLLQRNGRDFWAHKDGTPWE
jgi:uncharacterized cupin superfamily protein